MRKGYVITLVLIAGLIVGYFVLPSFEHTPEYASPLKCTLNLRDIAIGLAQYAENFQGRYPPDLNSLVRLKYLRYQSSLYCPCDRIPASTQPYTSDPIIYPSSYVYCGSSANLRSNPSMILAYEKQAKLHSLDHLRGGVLFADGHAELMVSEDLSFIHGEITAGHNPPRWPPK